jgi:hypothetical protein
MLIEPHPPVNLFNSSAGEKFPHLLSPTGQGIRRWAVGFGKADP